MKQNRGLGLVFLAGVCICWIVASFITQYLVSRAGTGDDEPQLPAVMLALMCSSMFVVYLPIIHFSRRLRRKQSSVDQAAGSSEAQEPLLSERGVAGDDDAGHHHSDASEHAFNKGHGQQQHLVHSDWYLLKVALMVAPSWFAAQWTFAASLAYTSVTSNTILSSTSCVMALIGCALFLGESITGQKAGGVLLCVAGTAVVTLVDSSGDGSAAGSPPAPLLGDMLALLSVALYTLYTLTMQKMLRRDSSDDAALFFGYIGLISCMVLGPTWLWLWATQSTIVAHATPHVLSLVAVQGVVDYVVADYLWARAVLLLGPTLASVGLSMQVPVAAAVDVVRGTAAWSRSIK
eukprot:CAMPEP_0202898604 /NCGR_PEP_ID=MMETSP1392-20130828/7088_1 /ASSEMBLY_ACC=CAM_ASM_000868 /TAXON_ID=225041 /ORGANISM="Chlamydomonas chlamydogama, Strain SAG 11-48b" /LENGTH=347 /DNA_ID=CAMNT_0049584585 /DNA_START=71 /DNA_END=1111 /DNA_ORIENTATION=+